MRKLKLMAVALSVLFTIALAYATIELPNAINDVLKNYIPDIGIWNWSEAKALIDQLKPIGYTSFVIVLALIAIGFLVKRRSLSILGSLVIYMPVFGYFAFTMFFLAGIGILRVLWLPLIDLAPQALLLGLVVYVPYIIIDLCASALLKALCGSHYGWALSAFHYYSALAIVIAGLAIFSLGVSTWLYTRFRGLKLAKTFIYRFSRHPQYLGFLVWSYGMLILSTYVLKAPRGGYVPPPSLLWLISAMAIIGLALMEEVELAHRDEEYRQYRREVPFMIPLPRPLAKALKAPMTLMLKKEFPQSRRDVVLTILLYTAILIALSALIFLLTPRFPYISLT